MPYHCGVGGGRRARLVYLLRGRQVIRFAHTTRLFLCIPLSLSLSRSLVLMIALLSLFLPRSLVLDCSFSLSLPLPLLHSLILSSPFHFSRSLDIDCSFSPLTLELSLPLTHSYNIHAQTILAEQGGQRRTEAIVGWWSAVGGGRDGLRHSK